jgi:hypothetical protein
VALEKVKGSERVAFSLCETTTPGDENHLLPAQFTGRDIGICSLLSNIMSAPRLRPETGRLNSLPSWVKSQAVDYALTGACFRAGEIRILDSSGSVERIIPFDETERKLRFEIDPVSSWAAAECSDWLDHCHPQGYTQAKDDVVEQAYASQMSITRRVPSQPAHSL